MRQRFRETTELGGGCGQCCAGLHQPMYVSSCEGSGGKVVAWMLASGALSARVWNAVDTYVSTAWLRLFIC